MLDESSGWSKRLTFWILILTGIFLILVGSPLSETSVGNYNPYLPLGLPLIGLGIYMIAISAIQIISQRIKQIIIGLNGQVLLGLVILVIPLLPTFPYVTEFNFHTYSIVLGSLGIVLSLVSIAMLSKIGNQRHSKPSLVGKG